MEHVLNWATVCFHKSMGESFRNYSCIQDFEADFPQKVSLKILNKADDHSFSDIFTVNLKTINHLSLKY